MNDHVGPIYEVTLSVDPSAAADIDDWLAAHVDAMLALPGFISADLSALDDPDGRVTRVVRYYLTSDDDLNAYLEGPAEAMRADTAAKFGAHVTAERRILRDNVQAASGGNREHCLNCQAVLTGQYCGQCGQRAQSRLISVWELVRDALGDVLDADSRLWRTLVLLAVRPGQLTDDYLRGRRARFMPPFRTYLVLSLLFFAVAFFDPRENLGILFEPVAEDAESDEQREARAAARQEVLDELASEGILLRPGPPAGADDRLSGARPPVPGEQPGARTEVTGEEAPAAGATETAGDGQPVGGTNDGEPADASDSADDNELFKPTFNVSLGGNPIDERCDLGDYDPAELPAWLGRRLTRERVEDACTRMVAEDGSGLRNFIDNLIESIPAGLIILLPLIALVLKMLYPLSRRYYVEHLLLVVHFHAFVFLALIVQVLLSRTVEAVQPGGAIAALVLVPIPLYIPVYLYKTLRRVYRQGRLLSLLKFVLLSVTYTVGLTVLLMAMALVAAFSV